MKLTRKELNRKRQAKFRVGDIVEHHNGEGDRGVIEDVLMSFDYRWRLYVVRWNPRTVVVYPDGRTAMSETCGPMTYREHELRAVQP